MKGESPTINKTESPKTPGGISKSLLTPCRRVGLSRKWKKSGCSPFVSPLSTPEKSEVNETKKRKKNEDSEIFQHTETSTKRLDTGGFGVSTPKHNNNVNKNCDITTTPRNSQIPRKKSKILVPSLNNSVENKEVQILTNKISIEKESHTNDGDNEELEEIIGIARSSPTINNDYVEETVSKLTKHASEEKLSKPVRTESKGKYRLSLKKSLSNAECGSGQNSSKTNENTKLQQRSPTNLTKECIVVIQNSFFKTNNENIKLKTQNVLEDSDTECNIPLSILKKDSIENVSLNTLNDEDFIIKSKDMQTKKKVRNLSTIKRSKNSENFVESNNASQSSQEDVNKRTILVKKCYDKITKPVKAKSTGSITQKDIDEIKARIEMKKKLLMAKAMSIDTEELRGLIKKWQKGCQDALMELLELMKKKLPDRQNMDYAEILQTLKIPPDLVGYDSENDCFVTPEDTNVLLSSFKL